MSALALHNQVTTRFASTEQTQAARCECGELLEDEFERENGLCWNCQAEAATKEQAS